MGIIRGEIIAVGSELLLGGGVETNSIFLAEGLAKCGVDVQWKTIVGDIQADIASALTQACRRAQVIILTGGLGSTVDDCTRQAVARVTKRPLRRRALAVQALQQRYVSRGRTLTAPLLRQALIPTGAQILENSVGSAPGFLFGLKRSLVVVLPGVSLEAKVIFESHVVPNLMFCFKNTHALDRRVLKTFGLTELEINERLRPVMRSLRSVKFGLLASPDGVTVTLGRWVPQKIHSVQNHSTKTSNVLDKTVAAVRRRIGEFLYSEWDESIEEVVARHLMSRTLSLAVAESCTGGLIGHRLTQIPGSSAYLDRAIVCYSNQAKRDLLGVPERLLNRCGAVSVQVAEAMARGVRMGSRVDIGLSVTGIAGPGGGSSEKPVGLVYVGIDGPKGRTTKKYQFYGDRSGVKMRASQGALDLLRRYLTKWKN